MCIRWNFTGYVERAALVYLAIFIAVAAAFLAVVAADVIKDALGR